MPASNTKPTAVEPVAAAGAGAAEARIGGRGSRFWIRRRRRAPGSAGASGGGLPAGPFGLVGALEGVSYLVIVGFVGVALRSKLTTGSGLPAGPYGLTGAAEGLSFLSVLAGLVVLAQLQLQQGCVPNALPLADYSAVVNVCK